MILIKSISEIPKRVMWVPLKFLLSYQRNTVNSDMFILILNYFDN